MSKPARITLSQLTIAVTTAVSGFLLFFIAFTPGVLTPDSIDQYRQALSGNFEDGHPPVMAWLWSMLMVIHKGTATLLVFHLILLWGALALIYVSLRPERARFGWMIFIVGLAPWLANLIGMLWKDIGLAVSWAMAFALVFFYREWPRNRNLLVILFVFCFLYGLFVRVNAIFGAPPLLFFAYKSFFKESRWPRVLVITFVLILVGKIANIWFDQNVAQAKHTEVTQSYIMFDDLRALSVRAHKNLTPSETGVTDDMLSQCAPTSAVAFCYMRHGWSIGIDKNPKFFAPLKTAWVSAIKKDPIGWLAFRLFTFGQLLRWSDAPYGIIAVSSDIPPDLGFSYHQSRTSAAIERVVLATVRMAPVLFKPYFWLLLSLTTLTLSLKLRGTYIGAARALLLSGSMYLLGYLLITPFYPYRYAYWTAFSATMGLILIVMDRAIYFGRPTHSALLQEDQIELELAVDHDDSRGRARGGDALNTEQSIRQPHAG